MTAIKSFEKELSDVGAAQTLTGQPWRSRIFSNDNGITGTQHEGIGLETFDIFAFLFCKSIGPKGLNDSTS